MIAEDLKQNLVRVSHDRIIVVEIFVAKLLNINDEEKKGKIVEQILFTKV